MGIRAQVMLADAGAPSQSASRGSDSSTDEPEAWRRASALYWATSLRDGDSDAWEPILHQTPADTLARSPVMLAGADADAPSPSDSRGSDSSKASKLPKLGALAWPRSAASAGTATRTSGTSGTPSIGSSLREEDAGPGTMRIFDEECLLLALGSQAKDRARAPIVSATLCFPVQQAAKIQVEEALFKGPDNRSQPLEKPQQAGEFTPANLQTAGTFMSGKQKELGGSPRRKECPQCAPNACHPECAWAHQDMSKIEIPFAPVPSKLRPVALWCVLVSLFAAGVGSSLYYSGVFDPKLREAPAIRGCGHSAGRDQVEMMVKLTGLSKNQLLQLCPQVRTTMGDAVNRSADEVTLTNLDAKGAVSVTMYVGIDLMPTDAMTSSSRRQHREKRRGGEEEERSDPSLDFKEHIISGNFDAAMKRDWGIEVASEYIALVPKETPPPPPPPVKMVGLGWSCPTNSAAPPGATSPDSCTCVAGYYLDSKACYVCPVGSYCPSTSNFRQSCPANSITELGAFEHSQCECLAGFYGVMGGACTPCEFATYCPGQGKRLLCPEHALSLEGSDRSLLKHCYCMPGYYGGHGDECLPCPRGHACPGGAIIEKCLPGTFAQVLSTECKLCPLNTVSGPGAAECQRYPCPPFSYPIPDVNSFGKPVTGRDLCSCTNKTMFYLADVKVQEGNLDWVECKACSAEECPPGKFNFGCGDAISETIRREKPDHSSSGECLTCPKGKYAQVAAGCKCKPTTNCNALGQCSGAGRKECDDCSEICAAGQVLAGCGLASKGQCVNCPIHTYSEHPGHRTECTQCGKTNACGVGKILSNCALKTRGECTTCSADEFSLSDGSLRKLQFECTLCDALTCPHGFYRDGCGTTLSEFDSNIVVASTSGICTPCPSGSFRPEGTAYNKCAPCPFQACPGLPGKVYLDGCFASSPGVCRSISCTRLGVRELCTVRAQPMLSSAVKIASDQGIVDVRPGDSDAFGSAVAWISFGKETASKQIVSIFKSTPCSDFCMAN